MKLSCYFKDPWDNVLHLVKRDASCIPIDLGSDLTQAAEFSSPVDISKFAQSDNVNFVIVGTAAPSGVAGMLMGNTAEQILDGIECPHWN